MSSVPTSSNPPPALPGLRTIRAGLELIRPPNTLTAPADILAGAAVAGGLVISPVDGVQLPLEGLGWLLLATVALYAGGVTFNDVFDADTDARERPERAIPSGRVSRRDAAILGAALLLAGVAAAVPAAPASGVIAAGIAMGCLFYDAVAKHHRLGGPLTMGLCRSGNLLLGMSLAPDILAAWWPLALVPLLYIAAITAVSRGEVHGGSAATGAISLGLLGLVLAVLAGLPLVSGRYSPADAAPFLLLLAALVLPPFARAARTPEPPAIRRAVKIGVLSLIAVNAAITAGFAGWIAGLAVLGLLPLSWACARAFAVT